MLILACGSRHYSDAKRIARVLAEYKDAEPTVIHGAAKGTDTQAGEAALDLGYPVEEYPADWQRHGKAAGPIRNRQMLDRRPNLVIAFGNGRGTTDTVEEARTRGIAVREES